MRLSLVFFTLAAVASGVKFVAHGNALCLIAAVLFAICAGLDFVNARR